MFAIAYFVTTTTCLSGANSLKHKVSLANRQDQESEAARDCSNTSSIEGAVKLGGKSSAVGKSLGSKKQPASTKRGSANERKHHANSSSGHKLISAGSGGSKYSSSVSSAHLLHQTSS